METKMTDPEANQKLLLKAVKKAYKAQKLLNEAIKRLEASSEKQKKKHKEPKDSDNSSSSFSSSSSSSSSDTDDETFIDLMNEVGKPSKRHHGRKHHHGRRNRHGRDRSRSRSHSRGRSRDHSRGHSRGCSRGQSRGHSKTRDQELRQLSKCFRAASLQAAPSIPHGRHQQHHRHLRSHTRPEVSGRANRRSRSNSHERHNKSEQKKWCKNKKRHSAKDQSKHEPERFQSLGYYTMVPVHYDEGRRQRRRAHSEPRH